MLDAKKMARSSTIMRDAPMQNTTKLLPNRRVNKLKIIGKLWGNAKIKIDWAKIETTIWILL